MGVKNASQTWTNMLKCKQPGKLSVIFFFIDLFVGKHLYSTAGVNNSIGHLNHAAVGTIMSRVLAVENQNDQAILSACQYA